MSGPHQIFILQSALTAKFDVSLNETDPDVKQLGTLYGKIFPPDSNPQPEKYEPLVRELLTTYKFSAQFADSIEYNKLTAALPALNKYRNVAPIEFYTGQACVGAIRDLVAAARSHETHQLTRVTAPASSVEDRL